MKLKIKSNDELVHDVIRKFDERSAAGYAKYGSTLRNDLDSIHRWLNDVQEEMMDAILYLQKCKEVSTEMLEEKLLSDYVFEEDEESSDKDYPISSYCGCPMKEMYPGDAWVTNCTCK